MRPQLGHGEIHGSDDRIDVDYIGTVVDHDGPDLIQYVFDYLIHVHEIFLSDETG